MPDFSYQQVAATLASGLLAASADELRNELADAQASIAVEVYRECLKQLRQYPEGEGTKVAHI